MVNYAFDLGIWTLLFFLIGMYKPQWPLFFLKNPNRLIIVAITTVLIMITFTLYGEGARRDRLAKEAKIVVPQGTTSAPVPVPTPDNAKIEKKL